MALITVKAGKWYWYTGTAQEVLDQLDNICEGKNINIFSVNSEKIASVITLSVLCTHD